MSMFSTSMASVFFVFIQFLVLKFRSFQVIIITKMKPDTSTPPHRYSNSCLMSFHSVLQEFIVLPVCHRPIRNLKEKKIEVTQDQQQIQKDVVSYSYSFTAVQYQIRIDRLLPCTFNFCHFVKIKARGFMQIVLQKQMPCHDMGGTYTLKHITNRVIGDN